MAWYLMVYLLPEFPVTLKSTATSVPNPPAGSPVMTAHTSTDPSPSEQTGLPKFRAMVALSKEILIQHKKYISSLSPLTFIINDGDSCDRREGINSCMRSCPSHCHCELMISFQQFIISDRNAATLCSISTSRRKNYSEFSRR